MVLLINYLNKIIKGKVRGRMTNEKHTIYRITPTDMFRLVEKL